MHMLVPRLHVINITNCMSIKQMGPTHIMS